MLKEKIEIKNPLFFQKWEIAMKKKAFRLDYKYIKINDLSALIK